MEEVINGGNTDYRHYIYAAGELVAIYSRQSSGTNTLRYQVDDHQGSYASIISDKTPGPVADYVNESFTAYGNRRSGETWAGAPTSSDETAINGVSRRGYTGETVLGVSMGLTHLNGRIADAITGRFLSPDPYVPNPGNPQSFNSYSYVNNNPLSFTDPSGFVPILDPITVVGYLGGPEAAGAIVGVAEIASGIGVLFGADLVSPTSNLTFDQRPLPQQQFNGGANTGAAPSSSDSLSQIIVTSQATSDQLQSLLPQFNATISTDMDIKNAAGAYWDTDPTRLGLDANIDSLNEIQVNGIRDPGFNFGALGRSAGIRQAGPWLNLAATIVIGTESAYLLGGLQVGEIGPVGSDFLGQSFGKLGTVVRDPGIRTITDYGIHGALGAARGLSQESLLYTLSSPSVVLQQSAGQFLYLSSEGGVVVSPGGYLITAYPSSLFNLSAIRILSLFQ
jgi:RHS repeat-associated protein